MDVTLREEKEGEVEGLLLGLGGHVGFGGSDWVCTFFKPCLSLSYRVK